MTERDDRDCNTCRRFEPLTGICEKDGQEKDPCQEACESWEDWEETDER